MASSTQFAFGSGMISIPTPMDQPLVYVTAVVFLMLMIHVVGSSKDDLPVVNGASPFEMSTSKRTTDFLRRSKEMLAQGKADYTDKGQAYKLFCTEGEVIVLPPQMINELRSHPNLDFAQMSHEDAHASIPGLAPFGGAHAERIPMLINRYLTKALTKLMKPLSSEAAAALQRNFTNSPEWHEIIPAQLILPTVAQVSSRVFMGEELCADERWIRASSEYARVAFASQDVLRAWPQWMRPYVHWFLPEFKQVRATLNECQEIMKPVVERRHAEKAERPAIIHDDAIEWFEKVCHDITYDDAVAQITLSLVAIHTTSDLLQQTMVQIARRPELFEPLREECIRILGTEGLKKTALHELKLLDSILKECQRLKPMTLSTFRRMATKDIKLSSGLVIRKGQRLLVDNTHHMDAKFYENPDTFDPWRFVKLRQTPGKENHAYLVATGESHIGFGHGQHGCPGRFFAANELKIILAQMLLKYDWKLVDGCDPKNVAIGFTLLGYPSSRLLIRRRKEEIDFDELES